MLKSFEYATPAEKITQIKALAKDNAAITVLPEYEGVARVIIESEDHKTINTFKIYLGKEQPEPADDASRDLPVIS